MSTSFKGIEPWAARAFSVEAAFILQEAINWHAVAIKRRWHHDGNNFWFEHTRKQWAEDLDFISGPTLARHRKLLQDAGILVVRYDSTSSAFYRIDYERLNAFRSGNLPTEPIPYSDLKTPDQIDHPSPDQIDHPPSPLISLISPPDQIDPTSLPLEKQSKEQSQGCETPLQPPSAPASSLASIEPEVIGSPSRKQGKQREQRDRLEKGGKKPTETTNGTQVWESYREAYERAYGVSPTRNAESARHAKKIADAMPLEEAIAVAAFYLTCRTAFYVSKQHVIRYLAQDCEGLRTQMLRGVRVTESQARMIDRASGTSDAFDRAAERFKQRQALKHATNGGDV